MRQDFQLSFQVIKREDSYVRFVRSGMFNVGDGRLWRPGIYGYSWSSQGYSDAARAYALGFNASSVNSSGYDIRWLGLPLRCLARSSYNENESLTSLF